MMNVTLMAIVFGGKASTGIVLPLLCITDIMAVMYYHRHAQWNHFWKLIPWMILGILVGVYVGKDLDEAIFKRIMAVIIILTIVIVIILEFRNNTAMPGNRLFAAGMGLVSGFTTGSPFNTLETVAMDTPAILATDFKLAGCFWELFKSNRFVCKRFQIF